jgi:hypothetical protein
MANRVGQRRPPELTNDGDAIIDTGAIVEVNER